MPFSGLRLIAFCLLTATVCIQTEARTLRSPWDGTPVVPTGAAFACPVPDAIAPDIASTHIAAVPGAYPDAVLQAAYQESGDALKQLAAQVVDAADTYRTTGSRTAAQCVVTTLSAAAADRAMDGHMASKEVYFAQGETLSAVAVAYLKVRDSGSLRPDQARQIEAWLVDIAHQQQQYYRGSAQRFPKMMSSHNHHLFLAGYAAMSVGIAAGDHGLYDWGVETFRQGVSAIDERGIIHWDLCDQGEAAKCHLQSAAALVLMAEYGELNGDRLYEYKHGALHMLVKTATRSVLNPGNFSQYTHGEKQKLPGQIEPWEIGWAEPYARRWHDDVIDGLLASTPAHSWVDWGGKPA